MEGGVAEALLPRAEGGRARRVSRRRGSVVAFAIICATTATFALAASAAFSRPHPSTDTAAQLGERLPIRAERTAPTADTSGEGSLRANAAEGSITVTAASEVEAAAGPGPEGTSSSSANADDSMHSTTTVTASVSVPTVPPVSTTAAAPSTADENDSGAVPHPSSNAEVLEVSGLASDATDDTSSVVVTFGLDDEVDDDTTPFVAMKGNDADDGDDVPSVSSSSSDNGVDEGGDDDDEGEKNAEGGPLQGHVAAGGSAQGASSGVTKVIEDLLPWLAKV